MTKYMVIGLWIIFWLIVPFISMFMGIENFSTIDVKGFTHLENPTVLNSTTIFINWISFFLVLIPMATPNVPLVVSIFFDMMAVISVLSIISVFRGD